ncbi:acyltransferase, partial [Streptomyces sp. NPDC127574]
MTTHEYPVGSTPPLGSPRVGVPRQPEGAGAHPGPGPGVAPAPGRGPHGGGGPEHARGAAHRRTGQPSASQPATEQPQAAPRRPGRDRYLDLLRSIALVRVVVYHLFGWAWLSVLFPSMGVMFALAGSLMARSLSRPAWSVIRGRVRRLLPPLWAFSAVALALMFAGGWNPAHDPDTGGGAWGVIDVFNYIVPVGAPPYPAHVGSESGLLEATWAEQGAGPLWYLRAYLWFVVASPV